MTTDGRSSQTAEMIESSVHLNNEYDWDGFCAQEYYEHNYRDMRGDDRAMIEVVCGWFQKAAPGGEVLKAVDVGSGANLYPALTLLPHSAQITLYEYSSTNVEWLEESKRHLPESWRPFADLVCPGEDYESIRKQAFTKFEVQKGSIFELPVREWEIGTMFFVAESLTEDEAEFRRAMGCFLRALKPGAPFAAAFMECSQGYDVAGTHFPAVWLDEQALEQTLSASGLVEESRVYRFDIDPAPIRAGYTGYLVATGKVKG